MKSPASRASGHARTDCREIDIVNLSNAQPGWLWLNRPLSGTSDLRWFNRTRCDYDLPHWLPRRHVFAALAAAWEAARMLIPTRSILVSHGPRPSFYGALCTHLLGKSSPHLAFSFNFTDLPSGAMRKAMALAYRSIDRFVVFSTMERELYSDHFDIPIDRFDMIHWGVRPPEVFLDDEPVELEPYICAIGSQARDYEVLVDAIKQLPSVRLVIVATPENLEGIAIPDNVRVLTNVSLRTSMNVLNRSKLMVLPLRHGRVPCGHVTIVSAMHLGKTIVATDSAGVGDYVQNGATGRLVPPKDSKALASLIEELISLPGEIARLGVSAKEFAARNCTEDNTAEYFRNYLAGKLG